MISTFGPGAIVDLRRSSVMIAGLDNWTPQKRLLVDEPRLQRALHVDELYQVADSKGRPDRRNVIPSVVFPRFMVCRACRRLSDNMYRWDAELQEYRCSDPSCPKNAQGGDRMFPARFVLACENGHVDEFPWRKYVHDGATECRAPLYLRESGRSGGIGDVIVICAKHGARSMADAFDLTLRSKLFGGCSARRPWLPQAETDPNGCTAHMRPVLRGATNLYFPVVRSALSIPPWSDRVQEAVGAREQELAKVASLDDLRMALKYANLPELERWPVEQVWAALEKRRGIVPATMQDLLLPEWEALQKSTSGDNGEFQTELAVVPTEHAPWIQSIVVVKRLKEVRAIQAFTRIESWADLEAAGAIDLQRLAPISAGKPTWLPALLTRGEGIFVVLDESRVRSWEESSPTSRAYDAIVRANDLWRKDRHLQAAPCPPARYVLLHTISHLLMRQMALECGYSGSALRERIYASNDAAFPMAGVLIYTSTPDSEGSLGGLVDLADPHTLGPIVRTALEEARLCSSDPLCADTRPGDRGVINGAACHACLLLPETACERGNRFLDRAFVIQTIAGLDCHFVKAVGA